ncbi:MAG: hypothetical protein L0Y72_02055 [Gemmataceae bacterium]|nr:hypothetical protein [Gemmataceae bacterium]MCI0737800.1 hypothetical protein [Gemmataceae bacterium]
MQPERRTNLMEKQAELVRALAGLGPAPAHFDAARLQATEAALARKRRRALARAWPKLTTALGSRFRELFRAFAATATMPPLGGPLADGRAFARWLSKSQEMPDAARVEALAVDLRYRSTPQGLVPRRGAALRATLLHRSRRLVVAVRMPWLGEHWLSIPVGYARPLIAVSAKDK